MAQTQTFSTNRISKYFENSSVSSSENLSNRIEKKFYNETPIDFENALYISVLIVTETAKGITYNKYAFCNNNPWRYKDPTGEQSYDWAASLNWSTVNPFQFMINWAGQDIHAKAKSILPAPKPAKETWGNLFSVWFLERTPAFQNGHWEGNTLHFDKNSPLTKDLLKHVGVKNAINEFFQNNSVGSKPDEYQKKWDFLGKPALTGEYGGLEWYLGSYNTHIFAKEKIKKDSATGKKKVNADIKIKNTSDWFSATRFPWSWQKKINDNPTLKYSLMYSYNPLMLPFQIQWTMKNKIEGLVPWSIERGTFGLGGTYEQIFEWDGIIKEE